MVLISRNTLISAIVSQLRTDMTMKQEGGLENSVMAWHSPIDIQIKSKCDMTNGLLGFRSKKEPLQFRHVHPSVRPGPGSKTLC